MSYIAQLLSNSIAKLTSPTPTMKRELEEEELEETAPLPLKKLKIRSRSQENLELKIESSEDEKAEQPDVKKKKKKKDKSRDDLEKIKPDKENEETDTFESEEHTKLKKKKKRDRKVVEDEEAPTLHDDPVKKKKKKKHKRKSGDDISVDQEDYISKDSEAVNETNSSKSPRKKKIKTEKNHAGELEENLKAEQLDIVDKLEGTPSTHRNRTLVGDIYCVPDSTLVEAELYNVVMYILSEDISMSTLNIMWTKNCMPRTEEKEYLTKMYNAVFFYFTEEEDMKIRQRLQYLVENKIITDLKLFLTALSEKNGKFDKKNKGGCSNYARREKATRNIIGLYVGQDLPNRIAHTVTQRLIFLMTGSNLFNKFYTKKKMEVKTEGPEYKTKQAPRHWSLDEDEILVEKVLQNKNGSGYVFVEALKESEVDWDEVAQSLVEYGRTRQLVRERWVRTVKVMLLEGEQDPQEKFEYQKYLLEYVIKMGVKDKKEIRWKEVAPAFAPKTSAVLSQDFWGLIKKRPETTLAGKLEMALIGLEKPTGRVRAQNNKKCELRSQLLDFYGSLAKC